MTVVIGIAAVVILCFGFVVAFGAPYLPTLKRQVDAALELADLQPGQTLLELGCGDGRVLLAAARRGWNAVGYELNPILVIVCKIRTWRYRRQVRVLWGNFLTHPWPSAEAIFIFGFKTIMSKLDKKIMQSIDTSSKSGGSVKKVKLVSFAFEIPGRTISEQRDGVYLYIYK